MLPQMKQSSNNFSANHRTYINHEIHPLMQIPDVLQHYAMKAFERMEIKLHTLFTSTLYGGGGKFHPLVTSSLDKQSRYTEKSFAHSKRGRDREFNWGHLAHR
jgi:cytoplasmic iron level regulating protein YaaA (DUF328/UPF0246 family)